MASALVGCSRDSGASEATPVRPSERAPATPTGAATTVAATPPSTPGVWVERPASVCSEARVTRWEGTHRFTVHQGRVFAAGRSGVHEWDLRSGRERLLSAAPLNTTGLTADGAHLYAFSANPITRGRDSVQRLDLTTLTLMPVGEGLSGLAVSGLFASGGMLYWMDTDPNVGEARLMRMAGAGGTPEVVRTLPRSQFRLGRSQAGHLVLRSAFEAAYVDEAVQQAEERRVPVGADEATVDGFYELRRAGYPREVVFRPMRGPERVVGTLPLSGALSHAADDELFVVAFEDAFLGELHALPTAGGEARRIAHRLVLPQRPALVEGCLFFNQGADQASEAVYFTRVHPAR